MSSSINNQGKEKSLSSNIPNVPGRRIKHNFFKGKGLALAAGLAAIVLATFTVAFAMFQSDFSVANHFKVETFQVTLTERFSPPDDWDETTGAVAKEVSYKNTGTTPAMLRVQMAESWLTADGIALPNEIKENDTLKPVVTKNWNSAGALTDSALWTLKDGWYYYKKILQPNDSVQILDSVVLTTFADTSLTKQYAGSSYDLTFLHEYIKISDVKELWGTEPTINDDNITWNFTVVNP